MHRSLPLRVLALALPLVLFAALSTAQTRGAGSPEEAVAAAKKAIEANDLQGALAVISAEGLKDLASDGITGVLMLLAFSDPDDPMPGGPEPSKAELETKRKQYKQALSLAARTLEPYGLAGIVGKPPLLPETQAAIDAALDKADAFAIVTRLFGMMGKFLPLLDSSDSRTVTPGDLVRIGEVTGYAIDGDTATARDGTGTIRFERVAGRWYLTPVSRSGDGPPSDNAQDTPATPVLASGSEPEVVAGGVRVVKIVSAPADFATRPFNTDNGTGLALWIRMPDGQALLEIDGRASVLRHFGDDTGTDLGGRFGSFPKEFEDGTGGVVEIESTGLPAAGATALVAEGTISLSIATGSTRTRVPKVQFENGRTFALGKTTVTVDEVEVQDDSLMFTFNLPRQVMTSIRRIVFLDAAGEPLESRATGRGYFNQNAQMSFSVTTASRVLALEFEIWEGKQTVKVPFTVRAGLGLQ